MKRILNRRPSASMVVAMTALVVASGGTAIAAGLANGDKLIKKHSLSGNRLRNHTLTGSQINLTKLGKVPSAANADHAISATSATAAASAVTAANATNAVNAAALGGAPASAYQPGIRSGLVTSTPAATPGTTTTLSSFGAFTLKLVCVSGTVPGTSTAHIDVVSTLAASDVSGVPLPTAGTAATIDDLGPASASSNENSAFTFDFLTPNGQSYVGTLTVGVNSMGLTGKCYASSLVLPS